MNNNKIRTLAFDPGEQTGISFVINDEFQWGMTVTAEPLKSNEMLPSLVRISRADNFVIERPPDFSRFPNKEQIEVYNHLVKWLQVAGYSVRTINPGQWKNMVKRSDISSQHVRDATDMAIWYYRGLNNGNNFTTIFR